jgi:hypothetical protein
MREPITSGRKDARMGAASVVNREQAERCSPLRQNHTLLGARDLDSTAGKELHSVDLRNEYQRES